MDVKVAPIGSWNTIVVKEKYWKKTMVIVMEEPVLVEKTEETYAVSGSK